MNSALSVAPENLQEIFKQYLPDPSVIFVFSTDVVMNSWVDWCVCNEDESGVSAVPLERFVSWDKFKGEYVSASEPGKSAVPALLRKLFVQDLIRRNAQAPFFKKIINPDFAQTAGSFTDWISKMLPSLQLWHTLITEHPEITRDDEDSDFEILYKEYAGFLAANNFFEPAWTIPDFSDSGKKILIIYPETLEDFADYTEVFDKCPAITLVTMPAEEPPHPVCIKYSDSRKELRMTILAIRKLVADGKANWTDITLNVPDLETYRPYLERELTKYCVPFVIRAGFPLTSNCAGIIFNEILDCYTSDFSYDSVRALLLDNYIPWKQEFEEVKENLIREGQRLRCICSYNENGSQKIDIWKEALSKINHDEREYTFYSQLKKDITAICQSNTFAAIHVAWMAFKTRYLEASEFSQASDKIISRCITELNTLISIEKMYCEPIGLSVNSPYEFFINELSKKTYTPQNSAVGISVYPYKLAAAASFKYQFVIDSSQNNLELPFKRLSFLNAGKRSLLKLTDEDKRFNASKAFIRLYAKSGDDTIPMFSFAEESFAGFAIAHTYLKATDKNPLEEELEKSDFIKWEKKWFLKELVSTSSTTTAGSTTTDSGSTTAVIEPVEMTSYTKAQQDQFLRWHSFNKSRYEEPVPYEVPDSLKNKINWYLVENRNKHNQHAAADVGKITISQSDMKSFFPCPRRWIFDKVLKLEPDSLSTSLIGRYDMGNIHHKIMELYGKYLMKKNQPLPKVVDDMLENEYELIGIINGFALEAIHDPEQEYSKSPLTTKMLESQIPAITENILNFLRSFCKTFGGYNVRGVEKWYGSDSPNREWNYTGKIDCILTAGSEHPEDTGWTIIDYKNSISSIPAAKDAAVSDDGILGDFQMPMYITLIRENEEVKDITQAAFYAINADEKNSRTIVGNGRYSKTMEEYESTIKAFEKYAQSFAECVEESDYPLTQVDTFEDCGGCNYKSICRYNYTIAGRTK